VINVNSQSKVGHIDTQKLILSMPEMNIVQIELEKMLKKYSVEYNNMEKAIESMRNEYLNEYETQTDIQNKLRNDEIRLLIKNVNNFKESIQLELNKKEKELTAPIIEKANKAIIKVAKKKGLDYVLDSTQGQGVILADGKDLMAEVKTELGF
tara:strand:+ start:155 stop:613 length:459 start_codon:yes stop_codon:yes gene_type:complete